MRHLVVSYSDGTIAIVYPVPRAQLSLFDLLIQRLFRVWVEMECRTFDLIKSAHGWQLIEAIGKLVRSDKLLPFRLEPLKDDLPLLERLFLYQGEEAESPGELVQLHLYEPKSSKRATEADDGTPTAASIPFPTSGNADHDTIGNLLVRWQPSEVQRLLQWLDAEALDNVLSVYGELNRDPEERLEEFVNDRDQKLLDANRQLLNKALGLPSYYE